MLELKLRTAAEAETVTIGQMFQTTRVRVLYAKKLKSELIFAAEVVHTKSALLFREHEMHTVLHEKYEAGREGGLEVDIKIGSPHEQYASTAGLSECLCPIVCLVTAIHSLKQEDECVCERAAKRQRPF